MRLTGMNAVVSKVSALDEIIALGVILPAMLIKGHTVTSGNVPSLDEMKKLIGDSDHRVPSALLNWYC